MFKRIGLATTVVWCSFAPEPCGAQPAWSSFAEQEAAYRETLPIWNALRSRNENLGPAEDFIRQVISAVRRTDRVNGRTPFGTAFKSVLDGNERFACFDFRLCREKIVPAFRIADPPGVTDIIQYVFEATCFGFLERPTHRLAAIDLIDDIASKTDRRLLAAAMTKADRIYIRGDLADILATAARLWNRGKATWPSLRELGQLVHPEGKPFKGRVRRHDEIASAEAARACNVPL